METAFFEQKIQCEGSTNLMYDENIPYFLPLR